ncbi:carboxylesterase/lipase family protein [Gordonia sp. ABSL1-1]|uniref:carboxylesterase/lipase family protein n=1 Tax=Gordonia sp. ABSL1-1 TaxID=3053923 RepID=UPI0025735CDD|nr:carboxylesterase/lipase family protein [Gordonia sp. ABSL1-1]MDL9936893.1 carboxylesterase/lipase family protein [Gordonia sp. ABSL1-1]
MPVPSDPVASHPDDPGHLLPTTVDGRPVADTALGPIVGNLVRGAAGVVSVFAGIRYAQAPVGDLRWRRAQPAGAHDGDLDASSPGGVCPQEPNPAIRLGPDPTMSEDCLWLNVWTPAGATPTHRAPVMVWIHGGAYIFGSVAQPLYDATTLAATGDVVVVTVNYRLGIFGFADLSSVGAGFETNVALSDVLVALRWVRENIAAFGGNPDAVTIFGESAGGGIVTTLLTMPAAAGLFHRAIAQSSPATSMYDQERAERVTASMLDGLESRTADGVRRAESAALVAASMRAFAQVPDTAPGTIAFAPVIDGDLVPRHPLDVYRAGQSLPVPLLIGTNRDEATAFKFMKSPLMPITPDDIRRMFADMSEQYPDVVLPERAEIAAAYSGLRPKVAGLGVARDVAFRMPTLWLAEAHTTRAPVFVYRFDFATRMLRMLRVGAAHATELPYMWGNLVNGSKDITFLLGGRGQGEAVSRRMLARWAAFAHGGAPDARGIEDAPDWPAYDPRTRPVLVIDERDRVAENLDADLWRAWGEDVLSFR